jgi:ribonucleotide reductase alpha subunit
VLNDTKFLWLEDRLIMKMKEPQVKKWILPWVLLILISAGMVCLILREERGVAKYGYPLAASHDTAILLSNHVYGIQGVMRRKLSSGDGKWARMSLESDEYPSGIVSNVYVFPSGSRTVQVLELPGANRWFGTEYYEEIAKEDQTNKEAAVLFIDALKSLDDATNYLRT